MTLYNVPTTGYAELIINAGDGPTMVINRDEITQVYVGDDNSVASKGGTGDISVIDPLSYMIFDGSSPKYAIAAPGGNSTATVDTIIGGLNWAPSPAQAAAQIATLGLATASNQTTGINAVNNPSYGPSTFARQVLQETNIPANMKNSGQGVTKEIAAYLATGLPGGTPGGTPPLVMGNNLVVEPANQNMPVNTPFVLGPYAINQPGYDGYLAITSSAAGGAASISLLVTWTDASSGVVLNQEFYYFWQGLNGFFPHTIRFKGPTKGTAVTFTFTPSGHTAILNNFQLMQHSRLYPWDYWRSDSNSTFQSNLAATIPNDPIANILGCWQPVNIAAGATVVYGMPLWVGRIGIQASTASNAADMQVVVSSATEGQANDIGNVYNTFSNSLGIIAQTEIVLPKAQCSISLKNGNAAAQNLAVMMIIKEY